MKKFYISLCGLLAFSLSGSAQTVCNNGRYESNVYTEAQLDTVKSVVYGVNTTYSGSIDTLTLDFYAPAADTLKKRPLIIWIHGGSFIGGSSADPDVTILSRSFAMKGFACATINYRLGFYPIDSANAIIAILRAIQDLKASIRYFYKDSKSGANQYMIDTNNIFVGGASAGALTADHAAYLTRDCQIVDAGYITESGLTTLGGMEGTSGNPGYSDKFRGCISLCGALGKYAWLETGDMPLCSMHGTADQVVIYGRGVVNPGVALMYLDGDRMLYAQAQAVGVSNNFYTWLGAPHVPFDASSGGMTPTETAYMDTTINFVRDFLIQQMGCTNPALQPADAPYGTATLYPFTACPLSVQSVTGANLVVNAYPNPSNNYVTVQLAEGNGTYSVQLSDLSGRIVSTGTTNKSTYVINKSGLSAGVYFLKVADTKGETTVNKIIFY